MRADGPVEEVLESLPQHVRDRRAALAELLQRRDHVEHQPRAAHLDVTVLQRGHLVKEKRSIVTKPPFNEARNCFYTEKMLLTPVGPNTIL